MKEDANVNTDAINPASVNAYPEVMCAMSSECSQILLK